MKHIYKILYKRLFLLILVALSIFFVSCSKRAGTKIQFASYKTADPVPYDIYFDEGYFDKPASEFNTKLASATACLALAGFSSTNTNMYEKTDTNIKAFFKSLGFENYAANSYGVSKPTTHSFGVYIASKKIKDYTLIGIGVRGAGYQAEWASNFTLGENEEFAEGFLEASNIYLNFLKEYISTQNISGKIKIWTGGYSRGGATVNISAGRIDDALLKGENILSDKVTYTKDDIYAISYEPPAGKLCDPNQNEIVYKGEGYSNIYSILNLNDVVPFVAPFKFNFIRYGTDLFLPDIITDLDYQNHIGKVKSRLKALPNNSTIGEYQIDEAKDESTIQLFNKFSSSYTNFSLYVYLNDFVDKLCEAIGTKTDYVDKLQYPLTEIFAVIYSKLSPKESLINVAVNAASKIIVSDINEVALYDLQNNRERFLKDLNVIIHSAINSAGASINADDIMTFVQTILKTVVDILLTDGGLSAIRPFINLTNVKAIGSAHIPELLLTHITSLDDNYVDNIKSKLTTSFNKLIVESSDEFDLIINNQKYVWFENGVIKSKLTVKKTSAGYIIYMPADIDFKVNSNSTIKYSLYNHNNKYLNDKLIKTS